MMTWRALVVRRATGFSYTVSAEGGSFNEARTAIMNYIGTTFGDPHPERTFELRQLEPIE